MGGDGKPWRIDPETVYEDTGEMPQELIRRKLSVPNCERIFYIRHAFRNGFSRAEIHDLTKIDPWFLAQLQELCDFEKELMAAPGIEF